MRIPKFWNSRSLTINDYDPNYKVTYLGNVLTPLARGVDKAVATLWRNYIAQAKPDLSMKLTVCRSGLKALTREHGLTEYWANRLAHCGIASPQFPRVVSWVYRHEGRRLKQELRCHAVLCSSEDKANLMVKQLNARLAEALCEFRREKMSKQKCRLSVGHTLPLRKQLLSRGTSNFKPPLDKARSAPRLTSIEEDIEEEEEDEEDLSEHEEESIANSDLAAIDDLDSLSGDAPEQWSVDASPDPGRMKRHHSNNIAEDSLSDESGYSEEVSSSKM